MGVKKNTFQTGSTISQHSLPGAYSRLDFVRSTGGLVSASNVVIAGDCRGGQPNTVLWFGSPSEAEATLRSGPLLDAVKMAFSPGGDLVPQKIGAWRVNPGTQASRTFLKSAVVQITAKAWDYGLHTNQLKSQLAAGTSTGKKLTIQFQTNTAWVKDNITKSSFSIIYTGTGTPAVIDITKTGLTTTVTGDTPSNLSIVFSSFPTIQDLVNYINDQTHYTAVLLTGTPSDLTTNLDSCTAQSILSSAYTAKSDLQAIIDALNSCPFIGTAYYNTAATTRDVPDVDVAVVYFGSAVDGAYTSSEWNISLPLMKEADIQFVGTSSEDANTHALIKAHVLDCNSVTGKAERQFIVGGAAGETVAQAITRAQNLATNSGMLAYPGFIHYDFNDLSQTKTWSPAYKAAKLLGMQACLAISEPATFKTIDVLAWEKTLSLTDLESLIENGVCPGYKNRAGRQIVGRTVTTYQGSELQECEFSMMREALFVTRDLRIALEESFIGHALNNSMLGKIDGVVYGKLSQYLDLGLFNGNPAYWGYRKTINGDQIEIEYDANLTPPTNFIFVSSHMHVYASTIAA